MAADGKHLEGMCWDEVTKCSGSGPCGDGDFVFASGSQNTIQDLKVCDNRIVNRIDVSQQAVENGVILGDIDDGPSAVVVWVGAADARGWGIENISSKNGDASDRTSL